MPGAGRIVNNMKWVTKDYKGNPQVWYSGDVVEKIKERLKDECSSTALDVLQIIKESEE